MATPNVPQSVAYTCNVCGITGYNWHDPCVVPPAHLNHETFSIYCHTCDATFRSPTSATAHLQIHNCFEVAPVTSTHRPESQNRIPETPNVSLATPRSDSQSSDGLPLAQRPPPYAIPMSVQNEQLRSSLVEVTEHLLWLATVVSRLPLLNPNISLNDFARQVVTFYDRSPLASDVNFRHMLAQRHPNSLADASNLPVSQIAQVLLPLYESWYAAARRDHDDH